MKETLFPSLALGLAAAAGYMICLAGSGRRLKDMRRAEEAARRDGWEQALRRERAALEASRPRDGHRLNPTRPGPQSIPGDYPAAPMAMDRRAASKRDQNLSEVGS